MEKEKAPVEFIEWMRDQLKKRNLGIREAALRIKVSHPTISDIVTNGNRPSFDTVIAISSAFNKDPVTLLYMAGLLNKKPECASQGFAGGLLAIVIHRTK